MPISGRSLTSVAPPVKTALHASGPLTRSQEWEALNLQGGTAPCRIVQRNPCTWTLCLHPRSSEKVRQGQSHCPWTVPENRTADMPSVETGKQRATPAARHELVTLEHRAVETGRRGGKRCPNGSSSPPCRCVPTAFDGSVRRRSVVMSPSYQASGAQGLPPEACWLLLCEQFCSQHARFR